MDVRVSIRNGRVEKWASVRTTSRRAAVERLVVAGKRESERLANSTTAPSTTSTQVRWPQSRLSKLKRSGGGTREVETSTLAGRKRHLRRATTTLLLLLSTTQTLARWWRRVLPGRGILVDTAPSIQWTAILKSNVAEKLIFRRGRKKGGSSTSNFKVNDTPPSEKQSKR